MIFFEQNSNSSVEELNMQGWKKFTIIDRNRRLSLRDIVQRHGVTVQTAEQEDNVELIGGRSHVPSSKIVHVPDFRLSRHFHEL